MRIFIAFVLVVSSSVSFAGGGWTQKKGKGYYKVSEWWISATQHFDNVGNIDPNATIVLANTTLYAEYGITDKLTGVLFFPFFSHSHINTQISATNGSVLGQGDAINGIGDSELSLKYKLNNKSPFATSVSVLFGLPTGNESGGREGNLQTGDGEFNQMIRLDVSRSVVLDQNFSAYGSLYGGVNNRTNGFSDEFRFGLEVGISIKEKVWLINRFDVLESMQNGRTTASGSDGSTLFANNSEFQSYTLEGAYYVTEKVGFSASYSTAIDGALIFASPSYSVGVFLDWQ
ncbi:MAG: hypothetical protein AAGA66_21095 [Bacteroidota bacterium]